MAVGAGRNRPVPGVEGMQERVQEPVAGGVQRLGTPHTTASGSIVADATRSERSALVGHGRVNARSPIAIAPADEPVLVVLALVHRQRPSIVADHPLISGALEAILDLASGVKAKPSPTCLPGQGGSRKWGCGHFGNEAGSHECQPLLDFV